MRAHHCETQSVLPQSPRTPGLPTAKTCARTHQKKACCVQILHVYVYVYVYVYVHVYVYVCMYVGMYVCMYVMYVCMYVCVGMYAYIHTYMRMLKTGFHTCELYGRSRIQPFLIPSSLRQSPLDTSPTFGLAELFAELQPPPLLGRRHAAQKHVPRDFDIAHFCYINKSSYDLV